MYGEFEFKQLPIPSKFFKLAHVEGRGTDAHLPAQICCLVQYQTLTTESVVALRLFEYYIFIRAGGFVLQVFQEELTTHFDSGLFDQNAMAFLMKRYQESVMPHVFAADRVFRINAFWRDYLGVDFSRLHELDDSILFNHFSGCSMCAGKENNEDLDLCQSEFQRTFERANCTYTQMNQTSSPSYVRQVHAMLGQLPFCKFKPTPSQCIQYMDVEQFDQTRMPPPLHHRRMLSQRLQPDDQAVFLA